MAVFRVMSYHVNNSRNASGELTSRLCAEVIRSQNPDLVLLQASGPPQGEPSLGHLAGMHAYGLDSAGGCAFLSRHPLRNLQTLPLGYDCYCLRADYDHAEERIHLLNLTLSWNPKPRLEQVRKLFSDQILKNPAFPCATIIAGDFGLPLWGCGQVVLNSRIVRAAHPFWRANFPAAFPLWGRGRIYFQGPIHALCGAVVKTEEAKRASTHLPLVVTVETSDTRRTLKLRARAIIRPKHADPVCG